MTRNTNVTNLIKEIFCESSRESGLNVFWLVGCFEDLSQARKFFSLSEVKTLISCVVRFLQHQGLNLAFVI